MSIETYEEIARRNELYRLIQEGIDDVEKGKTLNEKEILKNMETVLGINNLYNVPLLQIRQHLVTVTIA